MVISLTIISPALLQRLDEFYYAQHFARSQQSLVGWHDSLVTPHNTGLWFHNGLSYIVLINYSRGTVSKRLRLAPNAFPTRALPTSAIEGMTCRATAILMN